MTAKSWPKITSAQTNHNPLDGCQGMPSWIPATTSHLGNKRSSPVNTTQSEREQSIAKDAAGGARNKPQEVTAGLQLRSRELALAMRALFIATGFVGLTLSQSAHSVILGLDAQQHPISRNTVLLRENGGGFCSAVLIDNETALTAGFCVDGKRDQFVEYRDRNKTERIPVRASSLHPDFNRDAVRLKVRSTDAALVRLAWPVPSSFRGATVTDASPNKGDKIQIAGFGVTTEGDLQTSGRLTYAELQNIEPYGRGRILAWAQDWQTNQSGIGRGACRGDAGGPLLFADGPNAGHVFAITFVSTGPAGRSCGWLTQGVRISALRDWIMQTQQAWGQASPKLVERAAPPPQPPLMSPPSQPVPGRLPPSSEQHGVARLGYNFAGETVVKISGTLKAEAVTEFQKVVGDEKKVAVLLEGPGGSLLAGIEIGNRIRLRGYRTIVAPGTICASACAITWLAGTPRHLGATSRVGFHAAYTEQNGKMMEPGAANALVGSYANRLGLTDTSLIFVTSAGPSEMNWVQTGTANFRGLDFVTDTDRHTQLQ